MRSPAFASGEVRADPDRVSSRSAARYSEYRPCTPVQRSGSGSQLGQRCPTQGSVTSSLYTAKWGTPKLELVPQHLLSIGLFHVTGAPAAVAYLKKRARAKVLSEGILVANKAVFASWSGETASCKNPPTGDCTVSNVEGLKGTWEVVVGVDGAPPGSPGAAEEENPTGQDDAQDLAQEELLKGPAVGVAMAVLGGV